MFAKLLAYLTPQGLTGKILVFFLKYILPGLLVCGAIWYYGHYEEKLGEQKIEQKYQKIVADQTIKIQELQKQSKEVNTQVVTKYLTKIIHDKGAQNAIQSQIDKNITQKDESQCHLSDNVVELLNDAATNSLPTDNSTTTKGTDGSSTK